MVLRLLSIVKGMGLLSLTALFPQFRPPPCNVTAAGTQCKLATKNQNALLYSSFIMMTIGAGGIRPCSVAFGADQFDYTSEKGRISIQSFFNWYYFSFAIAMMIALTIIVYIQDYVSWSWGLGIPTFLMFLSIMSFLVREKLYICSTRGKLIHQLGCKYWLVQKENTIYRSLCSHPSTMSLHRTEFSNKGWLLQTNSCKHR